MAAISVLFLFQLRSVSLKKRDVLIIVEEDEDDDPAQSHTASSSGNPVSRRLENTPGDSEPPIILLGLPRSGSAQIHDFFECNGYKSAHYCCDTNDNSSDNSQRSRFPCHDRTCGVCVHSNLLQERDPFVDCSDTIVQVWSRFDVETQDPYSLFLPQHFALSTMHKYYPNARWILNRRSLVTNWATNVLHWHTDTQRLLKAFNVDYYSKHIQNVVGHNSFTADMAPAAQLLSKEQIYEHIKNSIERAGNVTEYNRRLQALITIYQHHLKTIQDADAYYQHVHDLLLLNVDEPDAGDVLVKAFPGTQAHCWKFDSQALDEDWKDFSYKL